MGCRGIMPFSCYCLFPAYWSLPGSRPAVSQRWQEVMQLVSCFPYDFYGKLRKLPSACQPMQGTLQTSQETGSSSSAPHVLRRPSQMPTSGVRICSCGGLATASLSEEWQWGRSSFCTATPRRLVLGLGAPYHLQSPPATPPLTMTVNNLSTLKLRHLQQERTHPQQVSLQPAVAELWFSSVAGPGVSVSPSFQVTLSSYESIRTQSVTPKR